MKKKKKPNYPTKKGQEFLGIGEAILTVKSFYGDYGIPYDTIQEAFENNPLNKEKGDICVENVEFGGITPSNEAYVLQESV